MPDQENKDIQHEAWVEGQEQTALEGLRTPQSYNGIDMFIQNTRGPSYSSNLRKSTYLK